MAQDSAALVPKRSSRLAAAIDLGKNGLALLRDFMLFLLILLLLLFPTRLNDILTRAGFEEGSIVGLKWKAKLIDSDVALKEARVVINDLTARLDATSQALMRAQAASADPATKVNVDQVAAANASVKATSASVQSTIGRTLAESAPLVQEAQGQLAGQWGVVFGGDTSLNAARHEVDVIAPKLGLRNPAIFLRQRVYRSVSVADTRTEAEELLAKARQRRSDAYIVRMSSWCPDAQQRDRYRECL
jgi:hypothetical protein